MKYLKLVETSAEVINPQLDSASVWLCKETSEVSYFSAKEPTPMIVNVGDILYSDGTTLKTIDADSYTSSLGTALGVCVIPSTHMTPRFMSIKGLGTDGAEQGYKWSTESVDTQLTNYTEIACVGHDEDGNWTPDNAIDHTNNNGKICSDSDSGNFTAVTNPYDTTTSWAYNDKKCHIASPYNADGSMNESYAATSYTGGSINNCLSDFDGKSNTTTLVGLGTDKYLAANACNTYAPSTVDGVKQGDWYLPSAGELAYIMPRFKVINNSIAKASGVQLLDGYTYWSSTEYSIGYAYLISTLYGSLGTGLGKSYVHNVRPFVSLAL